MPGGTYPMLSATDPDEMDREAGIAAIEPFWERIRHQLENERHRVNEEIRHYPTPIPACDAQFNYLLEEQVRIAQEMDQLKALVRDGLTRRAHLKRLDEFLASSNYINGEAEEKIRSSLSSVLDSGT